MAIVQKENSELERDSVGIGRENWGKPDALYYEKDGFTTSFYHARGRFDSFLNKKVRIIMGRDPDGYYIKVWHREPYPENRLVLVIPQLKRKKAKEWFLRMRQYALDDYSGAMLEEVYGGKYGRKNDTE